jgi:hypothetical protein
MALERTDGSTIPPSLITDQVRGMGGFNSDEELENSLPESTLTDRLPGLEYTPTGRVKKPRQKKDAAPTEVEDIRLRRFRTKSVGFGGITLVKAGFDISGKPLVAEEEQDLGDAIFALSNKAQIDVTQSYWFMLLYLCTLIGTMIAGRTSLGDQIREFFTKKEEEVSEGDNTK